MHHRMYFTYNHEALHHAITVAARKTEYSQAKSELKGLRSLLDVIIPSMKLNPFIFDDFDPLPLDLIIEIEEAERKKEESRKAYYKAKNFIRNILKFYWFRRIRFANRAVGNMFDYTLITEPVPPTTVPADEFIFINSFFVRQQGGALVGSFA